MTKPAKKQREYLWHIKVHFLIALAFLMLVVTSFSVYSMIAQLNSGLNFGISSFYVFSGLAVPVLAFVFSYMLAPKQKTRIDTWFWITLLAVIAMIIYTATQQLTMIASFINVNVSEDSWMINEITRLTVSFIPVICYFVYLHWLRKNLK